MKRIWLDVDRIFYRSVSDTQRNENAYAMEWTLLVQISKILTLAFSISLATNDGYSTIAIWD